MVMMTKVLLPPRVPLLQDQITPQTRAMGKMTKKKKGNLTVVRRKRRIPQGTV